MKNQNPAHKRERDKEETEHKRKFRIRPTKGKEGIKEKWKTDHRKDMEDADQK